jgi:hypothetical protein
LPERGCPTHNHQGHGGKSDQDLDDQRVLSGGARHRFRWLRSDSCAASGADALARPPTTRPQCRMARPSGRTACVPLHAAPAPSRTHRKEARGLPTLPRPPHPHARAGAAPPPPSSGPSLPSLQGPSLSLFTTLLASGRAGAVCIIGLCSWSRPSHHAAYARNVGQRAQLYDGPRGHCRRAGAAGRGAVGAAPRRTCPPREIDGRNQAPEAFAEGAADGGGPPGGGAHAGAVAVQQAPPVVVQHAPQLSRRRRRCCRHRRRPRRRRRRKRRPRPRHQRRTARRGR